MNDDDRADRESLRATFDEVAATYHRVRPRSPSALFDRVASYAITAGRAAPVVLEIGPATGIATIPMAERGWAVTGVEVGPALADEARANTAALDRVSIVTASFDDWEPPRWGAFDLVVAATSWHWLDPETKYARARRHLRPGGVLAFWSVLHVVPTGGDPIFAELQDAYDAIGESRGDEPWPQPGGLPTFADEIVASGCFDDVEIVHYDWEVVYDADGYVALLDTFSGHRTMQPEQREYLYGEVRRRLAARPEGLLRRHWGAALHLARRR